MDSSHRVPDASIVIAAERDAGTIARHRYFQPGVPAGAVSTYITWLRSSLLAGTYVGWLAVSSGGADKRRIIGGCGLVLLDWGPTRDDPHSCRGRIVNMFVEIEHRRQNVARALLESALGHAARLGIGTVTLGTSEMAQTLYESCGFKPVTTEMCLKLNRDGDSA